MEIRRSHVRKIRYSVQFWFLAFTSVIGYRFYQFVQHFEIGRPLVERPSSIDAFLPIAGLMSFKSFLYTGVIDSLHPAALVMFVSIVTVSLIMKKGFCGWICPVGTVSQWVWIVGEKIFGKNPKVWKYPDMALRSIKYLLMGFFLYAILIKMPPEAMGSFFGSDYYKIADIKTMKFFTEMSSTTLWSLAVLGGLSLIYKNFWCRYLCPYGALLGLLSYLSPMKIRRDEKRCVHCHACTKHCPVLIDVEKQEVVSSPECFGCLTCVSRCPSKGALDMTAGLGEKRRVIRPLIYPVLLLVFFYLVIGAAMVSGNWKSRIPYEEYQRIMSSDLSRMGHPGR